MISIFKVRQGEADHIPLSIILFIVALANLSCTYCPEKYVREFAKLITAILILSAFYSGIIIFIFYLIINSK